MQWLNTIETHDSAHCFDKTGWRNSDRCFRDDHGVQVSLLERGGDRSDHRGRGHVLLRFLQRHKHGRPPIALDSRFEEDHMRAEQTRGEREHRGCGLRG